jgi:succinate dehydrogenase / fumarate reductase cytochrome b subunit
MFISSDDGEMFNKAAHFMGGMVLIRILEVGLFAGIFWHAIQGRVSNFTTAVSAHRAMQFPWVTVEVNGIAGQWVCLEPFF